MGSVKILSSEDGKIMCERFMSGLLNSDISTSVVPLEDISNLTDFNRNDVLVILVTPPAWEILKNISVDIYQNVIFKYPERLAIVFKCREDMRLEAEQMFASATDSWHWDKIKRFNGQNSREWFLAEAEVKNLLEDDISNVITQTNKFVFKPDVVFPGMTEVLILLLDDEYGSGPECRTLSVKAKADDIVITTRHIHKHVWAFNPTGLDEGEHELSIECDHKDIGSDILVIPSVCQTAVQTLSTAMKIAPVNMFATLLGVDETHVDSEIVRHLQNESAHHVFARLLEIGNIGNTGLKQQDALLRFCEKYNLEECRRFIVNHQNTIPESTDDCVYQTVNKQRKPTADCTHQSRTIGDVPRPMSMSQSSSFKSTPTGTVGSLGRTLPSGDITSESQRQTNILLRRNHSVPEIRMEKKRLGITVSKLKERPYHTIQDDGIPAAAEGRNRPSNMFVQRPKQSPYDLPSDEFHPEFSKHVAPLPTNTIASNPKFQRQKLPVPKTLIKDCNSSEDEIVSEEDENDGGVYSEPL